jgi:integrase/recombinase XerD
MNINTAKEGFRLAFRAAGKSKSTENLYCGFINQFSLYMKNVEITDITLENLESYFVYLQDEYTPIRKNGDTKPYSGSSLRNQWKSVRAFFSYCYSRDLISKNPAEKLICPPENPETIDPLSKEEVEAIIKCTKYAQPTHPSNRSAFTTKRPTAKRDIAMLYLMLDTGIRVGELVRLNYRDYNQKEQRIHIAPFGNSTRKTKSRIIPISDVTASALWDYLASKKNIDGNSPLFQTIDGTRITPNSVRLLFADLGKKAGIANFHPHRCRHTYATEFLRNGGTPYTLKNNLGHSDLKMCIKYVEISQADVERSKVYSPVANWNLLPLCG